MAGPFTFVGQTVQTTSGNSGAIHLGFGTDAVPLNLQVTTTAASGTTPSLVISVLWSNDGFNFGPADGTPDAFAAITATGTVEKQVTTKGLWCQINWTITGTTPSFTFFVIAA